MPVVCLSSPCSSAFRYLTLMHSPRFTDALSLDFSEAKFRPAFEFPIPLCRLRWFCYWISDIKLNLFFVVYVKRNERLFLLIKIWTGKQNFNLISRLKELHRIVIWNKFIVISFQNVTLYYWYYDKIINYKLCKKYLFRVQKKNSCDKDFHWLFVSSKATATYDRSSLTMNPSMLRDSFIYVYRAL